MVKRFQVPALIGAVILLSGCIAPQERTSVTVGYYNVKGTSFAELDREIALHGPRVSGVGKAIASTSVRMIPNISFRQVAGKCAIGIAQIRVKADVTLPRLSDRERAAKELRSAFVNIEEYARIHESVHVNIADQHAELAEKKIRQIPAQENCDVLRNKVVAEFQDVMRQHENAQQEFDRQERKRIIGV